MLRHEPDRKSAVARATRRGIFLVLYLNPKKRGSQEQQLLALGERLRERKTPLTYVFSAEPPAWYARELERAAVQVRWLDFTRPVGAAVRLASLLVDEKPALVHFHYLRPSSPLVLAARLFGASVIVNDHVTLVRASDSVVYEGLKRLRDSAVNPLVNLRLAVSGFVAKSVERVGHVAASRIRVVENGIDVSRFAQASKSGVKEELGIFGRPLIVCVARLSREKGVLTAVRAMPYVRRGAVLALVGDGPLGREVAELAEALGVADRVRLLGLRNDVERLVAGCDVSIVPSSWDEAFGQAVTESMAAGKPVVVTRSGAMPEIVADTGVVVPKDDPEALGAAIERLLSDDALRARLGHAAQARARRLYDLPLWVDRMMSIYDELALQVA